MVVYTSKIAERCRNALFFILSATVLTGCATIDTAPKSSFMSLGEVAPAPVGYLEFCARNPAECASGAPAAGDAAQPASAVVGEPRLAADQPLLASATTLTFTAPSVVADLSPLVPLAYDRPFGAAADRRHARRTRRLAHLWPASADEATSLVEMVRKLAMFGSFQAPLQPVDAGALFSADYRLTDYDLMAAPSPSQPRLTSALLQQLNAVNQRINAAIRPKPSTPADHAPDTWRLPIADGTYVGDCKDYVLEKRRALVLEGVPQQALSIAVVLTARGEGHAVLVVATDKGEFVLDNLRPWVSPWQTVGYRWLMRQRPGQPLNWVSVVEPRGRGEV